MPTPPQSETKPLWIRNGRILDPANHRDEVADLFVEDGVIVPELSADAKSHCAEIDANGLVVAPGLVDIHVHFRDPGQTHKEDIRTGTRAAAAGGFTTVVCMPNTSPVCDSVGAIQRMGDTIRERALIRTHMTGCLTQGMNGQELAPMGSLKNAGVIALTDDGKCVQSAELMRRILEYAKMLNLPVLDHCQDDSLTRDAVMAEGDVSLKLGLTGWPAAAEELIVARNAILSRETRARIHCQHISSAYTIDILRWAKGQGIPITAEVSPHHLSLTENDVDGFNSNAKMNPPLRSERDRLALIDGLLDGTLDCICTDHAPHSKHEKEVEFAYAPNGVIGLETSLAVSLEILYHSGKASLSQVINWLSKRPAQICDQSLGDLSLGSGGDITVFDPDATWTVDPSKFQSKSSNCPWNGRTLRGVIDTTIYQGRVVFSKGNIIE